MFGSVRIPEAMIGRLIGQGGSNIQGMEEEFGSRLDIDDGGERGGREGWV